MKAKNRRDIELRRGKPSKPQRRRILIACEGDKVEPGYLAGLRQALGLDTKRMVILPSGHDTDPRNVVRAALKRHKYEDQSFDLIYCVVDRDDHPGLEEAKQNVADHKMGKAGTFKLIVSVPCFEAWLLLHLTEYSAASHQTSAAAKAKVEKVLPGYSQMGIKLYQAVQQGEGKAITSARRLAEEHLKNGSSGDPSSDLPDLLEIVREVAAEGHWN